MTTSLENLEQEVQRVRRLAMRLFELLDAGKDIARAEEVYLAVLADHMKSREGNKIYESERTL